MPHLKSLAPIVLILQGFDNRSDTFRRAIFGRYQSSTGPGPHYFVKALASIDKILQGFQYRSAAYLRTILTRYQNLMGFLPQIQKNWQVNKWIIK